ncbi:MAG: hypothetical protein JNJ45_01260 [Chthonomonas sp.]|nr:hypothetical protein [Chthonomonas sp.]
MSRFLFSAGEASGDAYAAALAERILAADPSAKIAGMGGRRLGAVGRLVADSSRYGAMGIIEAALVAPRVIRGRNAMLRELKSGEPGVFVPIDFGFVNVKLTAAAKARGWRVLYFVPPGSWRRRDPNPQLGQVSHEIVTPFPWSAEAFARQGVSAHWFGHPLVEMLAQTPTPPERAGIALLPGSREHELAYNLPILARVVREVGMPAEIAVASSLDPKVVQQIWRQAVGDHPVTLTQNDTSGVLKRAVAALVCSGTATLEAALCDTPCVVVYRGSKLMEIEYRIRKPKFDFISLPNILLQRGLLPELIQHAATEERILQELRDIVPGGNQRAAQLAGFAELREACGPPNAITKTAELALQMARKVSS